MKQCNIQLREQKEKNENAQKLLSYSRENGMDIAEVLQVIEENKIVIRSSNGTKYLVNKRKCIDLNDLKVGVRVATSSHSFTILHILPASVDPQVFSFIDNSNKEQKEQQVETTKETKEQQLQNDIEQSSMQLNPMQLGIGGLTDVIHTLYNTLLLPLTQPQLFKRLGIQPPHAVLLCGSPGTGKTLICSKLAQLCDCVFIKLVGSQLVQKYIGESSRIITEMFEFARRQPRCIIMIDEIDSICTKRQANGSGSDKEIQRAMLTLLTELDGINSKKGNQPSCIFCTNRPKLLDPAFLRSGRMSEIIEIPLPGFEARYEILQVHSKGVQFADGISWKKIVQQSDGFNGADLRNVITEAGLQAIRQNRSQIEMKDLLEGVRIIKKSKEIEGKDWN